MSVEKPGKLGEFFSFFVTNLVMHILCRAVSCCSMAVVWCDRGHVCLIVNVACKWGFTAKNYQQLQALYDELADSKGLRILAFPCNQFGGQVSLTFGHPAPSYIYRSRRLSVCLFWVSLFCALDISWKVRQFLQELDGWRRKWFDFVDDPEFFWGFWIIQFFYKEVVHEWGSMC